MAGKIRKHRENPANRRIVARLLDWFDENRRDLPWRDRTGDPYAQWVAEVMLQQTRVETVVPHYKRFMQRFPTVQSLAEADLDTVLRFWQGLGYYRRLHHLHRAARLLVDQNLPIPRTAAELRELPGVGDYTAAAIASIAFGEQAAAVDGNVARVLSRLYAVRLDVLSTAGKRRIQQLADELVPSDRPGDFNQAWMDLASSLCTPRSPKCDLCHLQTDCIACEKGLTDKLPCRGKSKSNGIRNVRMQTVIFLRGERFLIRRRPDGGLWSGLWELPGLEVLNTGTIQQAIRQLARQCALSTTGKSAHLGCVEHQLTHRHFSFEVIAIKAIPIKRTGTSRKSRPQTPPTEWTTLERIGEFAVSTAHRKILKLFHDWRAREEAGCSAEVHRGEARSKSTHRPKNPSRIPGIVS